MSLSARAAEAEVLVRDLQRRFVQGLRELLPPARQARGLAEVRWQRDGGRHGGGVRYQAAAPRVFDRASVNVSVVHYADEPRRRLASATALSAIVHPRNPHAPSVHIHLSWTELKSGEVGWRWMADLNPSLPREDDGAHFADALRAAAPDHFEAAQQAGDAYFYIPALGRHRGLVHTYVEGHNGDWETDLAQARRFGEAAIDAYLVVLARRLDTPADEADRQAQLAYHTLYLFQVLTLDRGTTAGLLAHRDNDIGVLGSLPSRIDPTLLRKWKFKVEPLQLPLVQGLIDALDADGRVDDAAKHRLVDAVRAYYAAHPEGLSLQATGRRAPVGDYHRS